MATVSVVSSQKAQWRTQISECCGEPGGMNNCCYVLCCPCCAAGSVATASKRDYCMSCCIIPTFLPCIYPCWLAYDRQALVSQYNIEDGFSGVAPCLFCFCAPCMLCQETNFVAHATLSGLQPGVATGQTIVIGQQAMQY